MRRIEHAVQQREAIIASVRTDPRLALLKRLEEMGERLTQVIDKPWAIEQMSPSERLVRAALKAGDVGSSAFRRELGHQLGEWTAA